MGSGHPHGKLLSTWTCDLCAPVPAGRVSAQAGLGPPLTAQQDLSNGGAGAVKGGTVPAHNGWQQGAVEGRKVQMNQLPGLRPAWGGGSSAGSFSRGHVPPGPETETPRWSVTHSMRRSPNTDGVLPWAGDGPEQTV